MKKSYMPINMLLAALTAMLIQPATKAAEPEKMVTIVATDTLKFSVTRIEAKPGELIHVQLRNEGTGSKDGMGHNWVLLKAGADPMAFAMTAISAKDQGYMPKSLLSEVLASIPMLGPKQVGDVTFTTPTKPGHYPFICSCAGHSMAGMSGELIVK